MTYNSKPKTNGAFSLVEMLVVIAVIGILAAIAVPQISNINNAANDAKYRRNAQNLASVCASAQAAGYDFVSESGGDLGDTIEAIVTGATITDTTSPFYNTFFGVPNMSADEQTGTEDYLAIDNGVLVYGE